MGSIVKKLYEGRIDWPMRGSRMVIEDKAIHREAYLYRTDYLTQE